MAYDGIVTRAVVRELQKNILLGKIEKVYQPEADELVFHIHTKNGNRKLFASAGSAHARLHFIESNPVNPPAPLSFCMLLRKHLQGGRITAVKQKDSERIIEISLETLNELGFTVSKKLIFEIMGKHSNIVLVDLASGKIIDAIKRVSFDVNRVRQILPLGSHDMFLAEVVNVLVDDRYIDSATGRFDLERAGLVAYSHGEYFRLGELIGHFGWSVRRRKIIVRERKGRR